MDLDFIRSKFPALKSGYTFMDNAGGSQTLSGVISRISDYLIDSNVQLGASYDISKLAGDRLSRSIQGIAELINAKDPKEVIVGPSSTMMLRILSLCISKQWKPGDEVIVTNSDHEANVSPWMDLKEKGITVKIWKLNPETFDFELDDLKSLLTERTKLVAVTHVSNILGTINPIASIAKLVHQAKALICVDGVAYAPHRHIDVQELNVDFYVFSTYKVYGPHLAVMYGKYDLLRNMDGINHYFVSKDEVPYKFQPGNYNFELTYSLAGIPEYLKEVYNYHFPDKIEDTSTLKFKGSYDLFAQHEENIAVSLIDYLNSKNKVRIIGSKVSDRSKRVATISFVHSEQNSDEIVTKVDPYKIGIRFGDFYAKKLIHDADLEKKNGVVRVSLVHYNTMQEVDSLIEVFDRVFKD